MSTIDEWADQELEIDPVELEAALRGILTRVLKEIRMSNTVRDTWRDQEGFGRAIEVEPRTWSQVGADELDHSTGCEFITARGILPCSCDNTRKRFADPYRAWPKGWWWDCWFRWQEARVERAHWGNDNPRRAERVKWPVTGADGDPWVPGVDFDDSVQS